MKTDSSVIFQFLYLFFRFYTVIILDYFPLQFPFSSTKSVFFRFPRISVSVDGNNYACLAGGLPWPNTGVTCPDSCSAPMSFGVVGTLQIFTDDVDDDDNELASTLTVSS